MAFQLSPGVLVKEVDLTTVVPAVASSAGAFVGGFQWGPVEEVRTMASENNLVEVFGKPNDEVSPYFFTAANFLAYGNNLQVIRVVGTAAKNAVANANATALLIKNEDQYLGNYSTGSQDVGEFAAKYPGVLGNSIAVVMFDANTASTVSVTLGTTTVDVSSLFTANPGTSPYVSERGGSNDEMHVAILDATGAWTGVVGTVLERYEFISKAVDAKRPDGTNIYYKNVLNNQSKYIWWMDHPAEGTNWGSEAQGTAFAQLSAFVNRTLVGGVDQNDAANIDLTDGFAIFANDELYDISLFPLGPASATEIQYAIDNVAESRKDCVVFYSPEQSDVVNNPGLEASSVVEFKNTSVNRSTSYAVMDSGWKYQYDRYNDVYRWVPLNGDIAGLCARTDSVADPWFSPAGYNRGTIKNVVKLAFTPNKTERDTLYKAGVNPVVSFPGQGVLLFGDKTNLSRPSAFDRINVRRLFIILEKSIATAAKYQLFEFNDAFTRAQFRNIVEPFLRDVQGRRGITDFKVVCDETNNTGEVIDRNEFVADIYIKPARSINFITLSFIATRTGISFEEVGA